MAEEEYKHQYIPELMGDYADAQDAGTSFAFVDTGDAATNVPSTTQGQQQGQPQGRSFGDAFSEGLGRGIDALASGGNMRSVIGSTISGWANTEGHQAQKLRLAKMYRDDAIGRSNMDVQLMKNQEWMGEHDTRQALAMARQRNAYRYLNAEDAAQVDKYMSGMFDTDARLSQFTPYAKREFMNSPQYRQYRQAMYLGRLLTKSLKSPEDWARAKQAIADVGGEVFERDGKQFVRYGDQEMELNEANAVKIWKLAQEDFEKAINVHAALLPTNLAGDVMMQKQAQAIQGIKDVFGGDLVKSQAWADNYIKTRMTRDQKIYMGARQALLNYIKNPNDPAAQQQAEMFLPLLQEKGYDVDMTNPAQIMVNHRGADGQYDRTMTLQQFADELEKLDTGSKEMNDAIAREVKLYQDAQRLNLVKQEVAASKAAAPLNARDAQRATASLQAKLSDDERFAELPDDQKAQVASSRAARRSMELKTLLQSAGDPARAKELVVDMGGKVAEKDGKLVATLHGRTFELTPEGVGKEAERASKMLDEEIALAKEWGDTTMTTNNDYRYNFDDDIEAAFGTQDADTDRIAAQVGRNAGITPREMGLYQASRFLRHADTDPKRKTAFDTWEAEKSAWFDEENGTPSRFEQATGYKVDLSGDKPVFYRENAQGERVEQLSLREMRRKLIEKDKAPEKFRRALEDYKYAAKEAAAKEKAKNGKKNGSDGEEGGEGKPEPLTREEYERFSQVFGNEITTVPPEKLPELRNVYRRLDGEAKSRGVIVLDKNTGKIKYTDDVALLRVMAKIENEAFEEHGLKELKDKGVYAQALANLKLKHDPVGEGKNKIAEAAIPVISEKMIPGRSKFRELTSTPLGGPVFNAVDRGSMAVATEGTNAAVRYGWPVIKLLMGL